MGALTPQEIISCSIKSLKELEHRKCGWKVLILKYDLEENDLPS